ncbi:hypothetical protein ES703_63027 [subsurface metagenome]
MSLGCCRGVGRQAGNAFDQLGKFTVDLQSDPSALTDMWCNIQVDANILVINSSYDSGCAGVGFGDALLGYAGDIISNDKLCQPMVGSYNMGSREDIHA